MYQKSSVYWRSSYWDLKAEDFEHLWIGKQKKKNVWFISISFDDKFWRFPATDELKKADE